MLCAMPVLRYARMPYLQGRPVGERVQRSQGSRSVVALVLWRPNGPALSRWNRTRYFSTHHTGAAVPFGWSAELDEAAGAARSAFFRSFAHGP
jgi:hypothetical protein